MHSAKRKTGDRAHESGTPFLRSATESVLGRIRSGEKDEESEPEAPEASRTWRRKARGIYRRRLRLSLPELYLQLGAALATEQRFDEAADAFQRALDEGGVGEEDVLEDLVHAAEGAEARDLALRARLELSLVSPDRASELVGRAAALVDESVADAQGRWVLDKWHPEFEKHDAAATARFEAAVLTGRIALFLGDDKAALALFAEATAAAPQRGPVAARTALENDALPKRLQADDDQSHWLKARAYEALGVPERAIEEVDVALATSDEVRQDVAMLEFKVRLLEESGRQADAASALVALGRRHDVEAHHSRAVEAYGRATQLNPEDAEGWWYLGDSRRLAAAVASSGGIDIDQLGRAREELRAGLAIRAPSSTESWVYWSAALLAEEFAGRTDHPDDLLFEATLCAEQSVALQPGQASPWTLLVRHYRTLRAPATAMVALAQAAQVDGTDDGVVMSVVLTLAELGVDGALEAIDRYEQERRESGWSAGLRGFVLMYQHRYDDAESAFRAAVRELADDDWTLSHRALARALAGDLDGAREDASEVLKLTADGEVDPASVEARALSALLVGDHGEASGLFEGGLDSTWLDPVEARLGLACVEQLGGDPARASVLRAEAAELVRYPRNVAAATVSLDLLECLDAQVDRDAALAPFAQAAERLAERTFGTAEALDELAAVEAANTAGDSRWLTAVAARGRVLASRQEWVHAADTYAALLPYSSPGSAPAFTPARSSMVGALVQETQAAAAAGDAERSERAHRRLVELGEVGETEVALGIAAAHRFAGRPEDALLALEPVTAAASRADDKVAAWRVTGDVLLDLGRSTDASGAYQRALEALPKAAVEDRAVIHARMGVAAATAGDPLAALGFMRAGLDAVRPQEGRTRAAQAVIAGAVGGPFVADVPFLPMTLRALIEDRDQRRGQRRRLASARFETLRAGPARFGGAVPVALEADDAMFPHGAATEGVAELIDEAIPAMRARILSETGVLAPGIRVRPSEALPDGAFTVHLHGVPFAGGRVPEAAQLCTDAQACHDHGLTGERLANAWLGPPPAVWLDPDQAREANSAGLPLLGPYDAMLWNLEGLVRFHLQRLVGLAEVDYMVEDWRTENPSRRSEVVARALPNQRARIGLAAMVRRLVGERISVSDIGRLLEAYASVGSEPEAVEQAVETARSTLAQIPAPILETSPA